MTIIWLLVGLGLIVLAVSMSKENRKKDIPLTIVVTVMLLAFGLNSTLWGAGPACTIRARRIDLWRQFIRRVRYQTGKGAGCE